jgi:peroxiredoxin
MPKYATPEDRYFPQGPAAIRGNILHVSSVLKDMHMLIARPVRTGLIHALIVLGLLLVGANTMAAGVGEVAPDFEVTTLDGREFRLSEYRGRKPVYVIFWNTWCSYCIKKTPRYQKLQEQFGDKIEIIAINTTWSDSPEEVDSFEKNHELKYSTAFDTGELVTDQYRVRTVPTEFIVDLDGIIRYRNSVPEYLAAHLPDWLLPYVPTKKTPALACAP